LSLAKPAQAPQPTWISDVRERYLCVGQILSETLSELFHIELFETRQIAFFAHDLDDVAEVIDVLSQGHEALDQKDLEVFEQGRVDTTHQSQVVRSKLEGGVFKSKRATWSDAQDKPKVNVNHMAFRIDENISVVPISVKGTCPSLATGT
jgi:hypothetical protein